MSGFAAGPWDNRQLRSIRVEVYHQFAGIEGTLHTGQRLSDHVNDPEALLELTEFHVRPYRGGTEWKGAVTGTTLVSKRSAIAIAESEGGGGLPEAQGLGVAKVAHVIQVYHWPFVISGTFRISEGATVARAIGQQRGTFLSLTDAEVSPVDGSVGFAARRFAFLLVNRELADVVGEISEAPAGERVDGPGV